MPSDNNWKVDWKNSELKVFLFVQLLLSLIICFVFLNSRVHIVNLHLLSLTSFSINWIRIFRFSKSLKYVFPAKKSRVYFFAERKKESSNFLKTNNIRKKVTTASISFRSYLTYFYVTSKRSKMRTSNRWKS